MPPLRLPITLFFRRRNKKVYLSRDETHYQNHARLLSIALMSLRFLRSAREFCNDTTAHTAAGIQPINVI
jgi:hypothetical protein